MCSQMFDCIFDAAHYDLIHHFSGGANDKDVPQGDIKNEFRRHAGIRATQYHSKWFLVFGQAWRRSINAAPWGSSDFPETNRLSPFNNRLSASSAPMPADSAPMVLAAKVSQKDASIRTAFLCSVFILFSLLLSRYVCPRPSPDI